MAEQESTTIILKGVRVAFPDLYVAKQYQGDGKYKYKAVFLLEPKSENDKSVRAAIQLAATDAWGAKAGDILKAIDGQSKEFCYISGDRKEYDGYAGMMALSASRRQQDGPPKVLDRDLTQLTQESGLLYAGAFVNAKVQLWAQDNVQGKGMRCGLITVQFAADGESFGGAQPANSEGFESIEVPVEDLV